MSSLSKSCGGSERMNVCWTCGKKIDFRSIDGVVRPIHGSGGCDGRVAKTRYRQCPKCKRMAYYVEHNGGFFWADELGEPWPKHPCFDSILSNAKADASTTASVQVSGASRLDSPLKATVHASIPSGQACS